MMLRNRRASFFALASFLVLVMNSVSGALNTRDIEVVRGKNMLNDGDFEVIDQFLNEAVSELVKAKEPWSIVNARTAISQRKSCKEPSARAQYCAQFSDSAGKYVAAALKQALEFEDENRRFLLTVNLLILVDHLEDPGLADLAIGKLRDASAVVRYWAVHAVTNPAMIAAILEANDLKLAQRIATELKDAVGKSSPEEMGLMAGFAGRMKVAGAEELLLLIADTRIQQYADWSVEYELVDAGILKVLCERMSSGGRSKAEMGRRFGQLYSYAIQRYVKGYDKLSTTQRQQLISVLVETEDKCVAKLLGRPQAAIKNAVARNDYGALLREHDRLLGSQTRAGELVPEYGTNPTERRRTAPLVLAERPDVKPSP